jgi:hypothetical protein
MSRDLLSVGSLIQFCYPRHNFTGTRRCRLEQRRIRITAVRDLRDEPLDPATLESEPHVRRGKLLVTGYDLDRHAERSFYVESMSELRPLDVTLRPLPPLRAAIIDGEGLVRITEMPDPRERYCQTFNEIAVGRCAVPA